MLVSLVVAGLVIAAGIAVYKLKQSGKAVTGASVEAGVKTEVVAAVDAAKPIVVDAVTKVESK